MSHLQLNIIIVGAGIGGLATAIFLARSGHNVQVLEAGNQLSEGGAGIQISPNAMRILDSMGLKDVFYKEATKNEGAVIRRYKDGKVLGKHRANTLELYGYHNLSMHRADYQKVLYDAALEANAHISFGRKVISVDTSEPSLNLQDGSIITADLMIAADGIGSKIRSALFPEIHPHATPDCAFRIILNREQMLSSPILSPLVLQPSSTIWFGPYRHIVAYTIRGTESLNIVFCGPDVAETGRWNEPADLDQLRKEYSDHEDTVKEILRVANECHKFRISETPDLPSWTNSNGRLVLLGDAAHAMMPYMAQGATQAIEDAAVLNGCLARAQSLNDISRLSKAYEDIRKPRAEKIKATSLGNMKQYGLPDGPEQEERDEMYRKSHLPVSESTKEILVSKPDNNAVYGSPAFSSWIYMYDTKEALREYSGDEKEYSKR